MLSRWQRLWAFYLVALFVAAAAAPHHHLDPIADLLSDRPSNSGTFSQIAGPGSLDRGVYPGALVEDVSCFACFHSDFVVSPAVAVVLTELLKHVPHRPVVSPLSLLARPASETPARAPPVLA